MNTDRVDIKIGVVGMSHLGIVSSICWSSLGWYVVGVDTSSEAVDTLAAGKLPIYERGLDKLLQDNRERLLFTSDFARLSECDVVVISLDTETDQDNQSVLTNLARLIAQVIPHLAPGSSIVLMSQVPVGFTRQMEQNIRTRRPGLDFVLYYWVETLVIGNAVERFLKPARIVMGVSENETTRSSSIDRILAPFSCPVFKMSYESAELTKASINLYLSVSVTFANVLADLCEGAGASMNEIIPALRSDQRIGQYAYIKPGLGIAGGNLERDLVHLQRLGKTVGADTSLIDTVVSYNSRRYHWVYKQLDEQVFTRTSKPTIAVWGLAYKKDTQSTKNSFSVRILRNLKGRAELRVYDPLAVLPADLQTDVTAGHRFDVLESADCLLVLTDWGEFAETDYGAVAEKMPGGLIIDCVDVLNRAGAVKRSLGYISIGERHD